MTCNIGYVKQLVETKASHLGLNEQQIETLQSMPIASMEQFLSSSIVTKHDAIDRLIVPFNLQRMDREIRQQVQSGRHLVMGVGGDAGFAYSIGLTVNGKHSHELIVPYSIGSVSQIIINEIVDIYCDHHYPTNPIELDQALVADKPLRVRIVKSKDARKVIADCFARIDRWTDKFPQDVYYVQVGDKNNVLPDEPGYDETFTMSIPVE